MFNNTIEHAGHAVCLRSKYVPGLRQMLAQCSCNYLYLMRLVPDMHQLILFEEYRVCYKLKNNRRIGVKCLVVEKTPYTTLLTVQQGVVVDRWLPALHIKVRLYHDAKMAEVVRVQRRGPLAAKYHYPNRQMLQIDEKAQCNQFLGEWLKHCCQQDLCQY